MKTVLTTLLPGEQGTIIAISSPPALKRRLMDMGVIEGVEVEMLRAAPLGDPIEIKVHNTLVALRIKEAETILVHICGAHSHGHHRARHRSGRQSQLR